MIRSIFGRLFISYIVVILLTTVTLGGLMAYLIRDHMIETKRLEMLAKSETIAGVVSRALNSGRLPDRLEVMGDLLGAQIWVTDRRGNVIAGNPPPRWGRPFPESSPRIDDLFAGTPQSWVRNVRDQADPAITVAVPVASTPPTAVFLRTPITGVTQAAGAINRLLFLCLLAGTLGAALFGLFISRGLTRPIADISQAAARFAAGDYASRTVAAGSDEIGGLGRTFNTMADALTKIEQNRRDFLANVSHELKTPVASIQALAEAIADGVVVASDQRQRYLATIVGESRRIDRLIHDLLDLAQLEAGEMTVVAEQLDLAAFLNDEAAKHGPLLAEKDLAVRVEAPANTPPVLADPVRLAQVLDNLIANAGRYSPAGAAIGIAVRPLAGRVAVSVADRGPGIPFEDQPYIWDRFYRVDKSRSRSGGGTGLGLAIAKRLVASMGGEISLASEPGKGTTVTFTLPTYDNLT
jgi:signal transduction histidine kinase